MNLRDGPCLKNTRERFGVEPVMLKPESEFEIEPVTVAPEEHAAQAVVTDGAEANPRRRRVDHQFLGYGVHPDQFRMPTGIAFPDFFEPFAIPVDAFKRYDLNKSLKIVFGKQNYDSHRDIYDQAVTVGETTHADIKSVDMDDLDRDYVQAQDIAGEEVEIYDPGRPTRKVQSFRRKWSQMFDSEGVVCSSDFPHQLRDQLKSALLDDETDCIVLYTGCLRNSGLKKFVMR